MPTYQYACTACGEQHEAVQAFTDAPLTECPACGGRLRKVYSAVGVVFKGSGFYKNDSRSTGKGSGSGSTDSGSGSGEGAAAKTDSGAAAKADSGSGSSSGGGKADGGGAGSGSGPAKSGGTPAAKPASKTA